MNRRQQSISLVNTRIIAVHNTSNYQRYLLWPLLKDPRFSGEAIYYLAAAPEMAAVSGRFFNLTIDEKPAVHALDRALGKRVWQVSEALTTLETTTD